MDAWTMLMPLWRSGALLNVEALIITMALTAAYLLLTGGPLKTAEASGRQRFLGVCGVWLLFIGWGSPLFFFSHLQFSLHMLQMVLLYFFAPPLLLAGIPAEWLRPLRRRHAAMRIMAAVGRPVVCAGLFNGLLLAYHIPVVMDTLMLHPSWHYAFYGVLLGAALLLWLPVAGPLPEVRLKASAQKQFAAANGWILTPACLALLFAAAPYETFANPHAQLEVIGLCFPAAVLPEAPFEVRLLPPGTDVKLGGAIMLLFHKLSFAAAGRARRRQRQPAAPGIPSP